MGQPCAIRGLPRARQPRRWCGWPATVVWAAVDIAGTDLGRPGLPSGFDRVPCVRQVYAMASSIIQRNKVVAKRKGAMTAVVAGGATAVAVFASPIVGVVGLVGAAYLGWDWLSFRIKNGMRF